MVAHELFGFWYTDALEESHYVNYTNKILVPTYKVNNKSEFTEWTDADLVLHRDHLRYRAEGSFTLIFIDQQEYVDFLDHYRDALADGYIQAKIYLNNTHRNKTTEVFLDFELANEMPFMGVKDVEGIEVTLKER